METRYANIERELLAIVFACQWFSTYLLGRSFIAESDHKPLEMIAMKNLANAPPRLQRMLLELQRYDVTIKYRPGKEMQLADALSPYLSASKVQENAKQHMYWTGINVDIEDYTKQCQECIKRSQVPKEPLQPHDIPEGPWRKLGIDYFAFDGNSYVLICDYFSKFPFLYRAKTSFWSLRERLIELFSR